MLARFGEVEKAVLHGSRAKGNCRAGSDIDLTLHGPGLRFDQLGHTELREHIERVGKVFDEREAQPLHAWTGRHPRPAPGGRMVELIEQVDGRLASV